MVMDLIFLMIYKNIFSNFLALFALKFLYQKTFRKFNYKRNEGNQFTCYHGQWYSSTETYNKKDEFFGNEAARHNSIINNSPKN